MSEIEDIRDDAETVADGVTALVGVTDEGLAHIAESIGGMLQAAALVGTVIGRAADKGKDGKDGKDGRDGIDGKPGVPGKPGRDGRDGIDGTDGARGLAGKPGAKGDQGLRGFDGPPGPAPVRVVVDRENQLIAFAQVFMDDGSTRRMAVRRDATRRFTELVRVA